MTSLSSTKRVVMSLLSVILIVSTLGLGAENAFAAPDKGGPGDNPKGHVLHSVTYQKTYADPKDKSEEYAFVYAVLVLHPAISKMKKLQQVLVYLGLWTSFKAIMDKEEKAKKAQGYYLIEKKTYKSKKPTSSYWGYSQTYIYSSAVKQKVKGKTITIGKTASAKGAD